MIVINVHSIFSSSALLLLWPVNCQYNHLSFCKSILIYHNSACTFSIADTLFCDCFLVEEHLVFVFLWN